ncbi:hypothetical protein HG530_010773 [Fusarium avenaceum]|nr:hypothetical protein HG530_010773 [Fusarium avenaceum]
MYASSTPHKTVFGQDAAHDLKVLVEFGPGLADIAGHAEALREQGHAVFDSVLRDSGHDPRAGVGGALLEEPSLVDEVLAVGRGGLLELLLVEAGLRALLSVGLHANGAVLAGKISSVWELAGDAVTPDLVTLADRLAVNRILFDGLSIDTRVAGIKFELLHGNGSDVVVGILVNNLGSLPEVALGELDGLAVADVDLQSTVLSLAEDIEGGHETIEILGWTSVGLLIDVSGSGARLREEVVFLLTKEPWVAELTHDARELVGLDTVVDETSIVRNPLVTNN